MLRGLQLFGGFAFIAIGVLGMLLPIMPGFPFLMIGVALLGHDHPLVRPFKARLERWRAARTKSATARHANETTARRSPADAERLSEERNL